MPTSDAASDRSNDVVRDPQVGRRWPIAATAVASLVVLGASALLASGDAPSEVEVDLFLRLNELPAWVSTALWPVVQLGSILLLPAVALAMVLVDAPRRAAAALVSGGVAWGAAELLKGVVDRPRPSGLLDAVVVRGTASDGAGFPSGHVAVATALAVVVLPLVPVRGRPVVAAAPVLVAVGRVAGGQHLPVDVVGGAALGLLVGLMVAAIAARMGQMA